MYHTLRRYRAPHSQKRLQPGIKPIQIDWKEKEKPAEVSFSDGGHSPGSCIRCSNPRCMEYSTSELELTVFKDFPSDKQNYVCATSAISWEENNETPTIDNLVCIMCGLCVSRCPVGAIYLSAEGAHVNDEPNEYFAVQQTLADHVDTEETTELFGLANRTGSYLVESDSLMKKFREKLGVVAQTQTAQFPNHLARNLLIAVGISAAMRRRGDVYLRMDLLLGPPGVQQGTGEVELGQGILDAPRNMLDNIAVLVARYELTKDDVVPLIVTLDLPNLRSEYWQIINDVRKVLAIKINTITIGALVMLVWNQKTVNIITGEELYIDIDAASLRPRIEAILKRPLNITNQGCPGLLESGK